MDEQRLNEIRESIVAHDLATADGRYTGYNRAAIEAWNADVAARELLIEVDRLKAENDQLHAELRHYRNTRDDRSVQP